MRILTFADMGIGNLIWYLPTLRALSQYDLTIDIPDGQLKKLIQYNLNANYKVQGKYDVSVNNFLCQRKQDIKKIWRIPKRIGHDWIQRRKFVWMFTNKIKMNLDKHEEYYNNLLLTFLGLTPIYEKINYPICKVKSFDIVISKESSQINKEWQYWDELISLLKENHSVEILSKEKYDLFQAINVISKSKLFIGNDSGLAKISSNLGIPTIQIFRWFTDCFVRARINGVNLIEPTLNEVLEQINGK